MTRYYRLKVVSRHVVDFEGPLHPSVDAAHKAARIMWLAHKAPLRIEVHELESTPSYKTTVVSAFEKATNAQQFEHALAANRFRF